MSLQVGLHVTKIVEIVEVNFLKSGLKVAKIVAKRRFRQLSGVKVCYSNINVKFENLLR